MSFRAIIDMIFPLIRRSLWFVSSYVFLLLCHPWLNKFLELERTSLKKLIGILTIGIVGICSISAMMDTWLCTIMWFFYCYIVIGYIKKYIKVKSKHRKWYLAIGISIYLILAICRYVFSVYNWSFSPTILRVVNQFCGDYKSIPNIVATICIFLYSVSCDYRGNKIINSLSKGTLAAYIIHQIPVFYPVLWSRIVNVSAWKNSLIFPLMFVLVPILILLVSDFIDWLRRNTIEKYWISSNVCKSLCNRIDRFYTKI